MPDPQPGQMEQRMDVRPLAEILAEMRCDRCGKEIDVRPGEAYVASTDGRVWHYGCKPIPATFARPTADLGDDGDLIDWLGDVADPRCQHSLSREALTKVADRLILYREAREQLSNALLSGTLSMTEHVVCVHFENRADAEEMFATLEGAALTHVENEGGTG